MLNNDNIIITILVLININSVIIGYLLARMRNSGVSSNSSQSFFSKLKDDKIVNSTIAIDDKKFVTDIKTDGLVKKYDSLGDVKQTTDNIDNSVNKLKNLKR